MRSRSRPATAHSFAETPPRNASSSKIRAKGRSRRIIDDAEPDPRPVLVEGEILDDLRAPDADDRADEDIARPVSAFHDAGDADDGRGAVCNVLASRPAVSIGNGGSSREDGRCMARGKGIAARYSLAAVVPCAQNRTAARSSGLPPSYACSASRGRTCSSGFVSICR